MSILVLEILALSSESTSLQTLLQWQSQRQKDLSEDMHMQIEAVDCSVCLPGRDVRVLVQLTGLCRGFR